MRDEPKPIRDASDIVGDVSIAQTTSVEAPKEDRDQEERESSHSIINAASDPPEFEGEHAMSATPSQEAIKDGQDRSPLPTAEGSGAQVTTSARATMEAKLPQQATSSAPDSRVDPLDRKSVV